MEISVIIPFYNVPREIFMRCINSIKASTFTDYEVIVVDDGSEKEYKPILNAIEEHEAFTVFEIQNSGVSIARNYGTDLAKGAYITYIDADDCIAPDFLEHSYKIAQQTKAEIVFTGTKLVSAEKVMDIQYFKEPRKGIKKYILCSDKEFSDLKIHMIDQSIREYVNFDDQAYFGRGCYARLIDSKLAKSVRFPPNIKIGEDIIWHHRILEKEPVTALLFESDYFYIMNSLSVTREFNSDIRKKRERLSAIALSEIGEISAVYELIWQQLWAVITGYLYSEKCQMSLKEKNAFISNLLKTKEWSVLLSNGHFLSKRSRILLEIARDGGIFTYLWICDHGYYPLKSLVKRMIGRE